MGWQGPTQNELVKHCTCQMVSHNVKDCEMHGHMFRDVGVKVDARNDFGEKRAVTGFGRDTNAAVQNAIDRLVDETGDETWTMNEWRPA